MINFKTILKENINLKAFNITIKNNQLLVDTPYAKKIEHHAEYCLIALLYDMAIYFYGDPIKTSKPFRISCIALIDGRSLVVWVTGQETAKITKKWKVRLKNALGLPVTLEWLKEV